MKASATLIVLLFIFMVAGCTNSKPDNTAPAAAPASAPITVAAKPPDELPALQFLADLAKAQDDFHKHTRRYALAYDELIEGRYLSADPDENKSGYSFKMRPTADAESYTVTATPQRAADTSHYFFMDQTGFVRAEVGKDATVKSEKFSTGKR